MRENGHISPGFLGNDVVEYGGYFTAIPWQRGIWHPPAFAKG